MSANWGRRDFIKTAAAGVGGLSALRVCGQSVAPEKKPLRVALIGCGLQGVGVHIPALCN